MNMTKSLDQPAIILLVEDNLLAQRAMQCLLEHLGFAVDTAGNGKEALAFFTPGKYKLVLMDIGLPGGMDGYAISKAFREMEKDTAFHAAIIGISAHASDNKELSYDAGMDEMLCKPLLMDQAKALLVRYGVSGNAGGSLASCASKLK